MAPIAFWQPIRRKLPLLITTLLCGVVAAFSWSAYRQLERALVVAAGDRVTSVSHRLATALAESDDRARREGRRVTADPSVIRLLVRPDAASRRGARQALERERSVREEAVVVELWNRQGQRVLAVEAPGARVAGLGGAPTAPDFGSRSAIGPLVAIGDTIFSELRLPVLRADGDTVGIVREFHRLASGDGGQLIRGLIGAGAAFLVGNQTGDVWTDLSRRQAAPPRPAGPGTAGPVTTSDGARWLAAVAPVPRIPWLVWVAMPSGTVIAPARTFLLQIGMVALVIVGLGGFGAWLLSNHITAPLAEVTTAAERIAEGDYSRRVSISRHDEFGRLARAFNTMTAAVEDAAHNLEAQQVELETSNQELVEAVQRADATAEELRAVVEGSPLAILMLDADGIVLTWNPAAERMFGWSAAEVRGGPLPIIPEEMRETFAAHRRALVAGESIAGTTGQRLRKDGTLVDVTLSAAAVYDPKGSLIGLLAIFTDMTEQKRAQAALAAEREFLRQVIDINPNFVFAKDRDGRFTLANRAVADAYGTSTEMLVGKTDADFNTNAAEVEAFRLADLNVIESGQSRLIAEETITDASGKIRWLQTIKRPLMGTDGKIDQLLGVSNDITDRKQLEAQLVQSQKMEAIGRLAGGIAHDFNNILTVIGTYSEFLMEDPAIVGRLKDEVTEIKAAADRAARLTRQLLAFSRQQVMHPVVLDLNAVVTDTHAMLARLIGEDIRLETRLGGDLWPVRADRGQLEQVIVNLAVNARDAMPKGGRLIVETANVELDEAYTRLHPGATGGPHVVLAVTDTGVGMDAATQARIFEPFFTTKGPGKGTGLGLATLYGIVRQSGGSVWVYSEPGKGSAFKVYLPRYVGDVDVARKTGPASPAARPGATVLLVEDDAAVRSASHRVLTRLGYSVVDAPDGATALSLINANTTRFDVVVTDAVMPGMSGRELIERLARDRPELPVVLVSGYTEDAINRDGALAANALFLEKPFTSDALARTLVQALDGQMIGPGRRG